MPVMRKGQPDTANVTPKGLLTNDNNNSAICWLRTRGREERAHDTYARVTLPTGVGTMLALSKSECK